VPARCGGEEMHSAPGKREKYIKEGGAETGELGGNWGGRLRKLNDPRSSGGVVGGWVRTRGGIVILRRRGDRPNE